MTDDGQIKECWVVIESEHDSSDPVAVFLDELAATAYCDRHNAKAEEVLAWHSAWCFARNQILLMVFKDKYGYECPIHGMVGRCGWLDYGILKDLADIEAGECPELVKDAYVSGPIAFCPDPQS